MYKFFRCCSFLFILSLFALGIITLSDIFIHTNTLNFQLLTVIFALGFMGIGTLWFFVYKNFGQLKKTVMGRQDAEKPLHKLMLIFAIITLCLALAGVFFAFGLLQRMASGTALFG